jgi:hypothetical protein
MNLCYWLRKKKILQIMTDKLLEVERGYGMEINAGNTKTMRISRQRTQLQIKIDKNPVENVGVHEKLRPGLP